MLQEILMEKLKYPADYFYKISKGKCLSSFICSRFTEDQLFRSDIYANFSNASALSRTDLTG